MKKWMWGTAVVVGLACRDGARPVSIAQVTVEPGDATLLLAGTQQFVAAAVDARGGTLTGRAFTWSAEPAGVATIDATGRVTAVAPGTAQVRATSEGRSGTATVTVLPMPVAQVLVLPYAANVPQGMTRQLVVDLRDANGYQLSGRSVVWSSDATEVASVSTTGLVTALSGGTATISATSEGRVGVSTITVLAVGLAPAIDSIAPAVLLPGTQASIHGRNLWVGDLPVITMGGASAHVLATAASRVDFVVPCVARGAHEVVIAVAGAPASTTKQVDTRQRTLAVGESFIALTMGESSCNELRTPPGDAHYLAVVFGSSSSPSSRTDVLFTGNPSTIPPMVARAGGTRLPDEGARRTVDDDPHVEMLERDRAIYARLRGRASRPQARARVAARVPAVGDMRDLHYTFTRGCLNGTDLIRARAVFVGTRSVVWEDSANALTAAASPDMADYYRRLATLFDTEQYDIVRRYYGDPLGRDGETDADGRVHMVFTQRLSGTGVAAFATTCDQYYDGDVPGSNNGEYFYAYVPTVAGSNVLNSSSPDGWFAFMKGVVIHEVKHIASFVARIQNNAFDLEDVWLEEGLARHAEELWIRRVLHRGSWKGNHGTGATATGGLYCDLHPAEVPCTQADAVHRPSYGMTRHFNELRDKLVQPWNWSPYGNGTGQSTAGYYQVSWSLLRYAIDRWAISEESFIHALNNSRIWGGPNLESVAKVRMDQLIGGWGLALFADDYPGMPANPDVQFPTWNLRDIYAGLHASPRWSVRWTSPFLLEPAQVGFGSFAIQQPGVRGGAHAYFELRGAQSGSQLLGVGAAISPFPSPELRIAVVRLP